MLPTPDVVLLVDPDPLSSSTLSKVLKMHGYAVITTYNFTLAQYHLEEKRFDLMLIPVDDQFSPTENSFLQTARALQPALKVVGVCTEDVPKEALLAVDDVIRLPHPAHSLNSGIPGDSDRAEVFH
jgi:DNA-binding NtrC family response regulator